MHDRPTNRELKVLRHLCLGNVERLSSMPRIGMGTITSLMKKGWIVEAHDHFYGRDGYKITPLGDEVFRNYHRLLRS